MNRRTALLLLMLLVSSIPQFSCHRSVAVHSMDFDWKPVADAVGKPGTLQPDGVYKIGLPRTDLHVTLGDVELKPSFALGAWIAFRKMAADTMVMGDLVLTETEVAPVMAKLQEGRIAITAVHNHLLNESPRIMYVHISAHGDAIMLARSLHDAVALTGTPLSNPGPPSQAEQLDLNTAELDRILGRSGKNNSGVYQYSIARAEKIAEGEIDRGAEPLPPSMGLTTAINFQSTGGGRAAITGDFVLVGAEVNPVISTLRAHGIAVTALHSHMLEDSPRLFFVHFWANDDALKLAAGLKAAVDQTNSVR